MCGRSFWINYKKKIETLSTSRYRASRDFSSLTADKIKILWEDNEPCRSACANFFQEISSNYPKSDRINLIRKTTWILLQIVRNTPISGVRTIYTDANKSGMSGYKPKELSKVEQGSYNSVQKAELYAILMVLKDFKEPLNILLIRNM